MLVLHKNRSNKMAGNDNLSMMCKKGRYRNHTYPPLLLHLKLTPSYCLAQLVNLFLLNATTPRMPVPRSSSVIGSGIGASLPATLSAVGLNDVTPNVTEVTGPGKPLITPENSLRN